MSPPAREAWDEAAAEARRRGARGGGHWAPSPHEPLSVESPVAEPAERGRGRGRGRGVAQPRPNRPSRRQQRRQQGGTGDPQRQQQQQKGGRGGPLIQHVVLPQGVAPLEHDTALIIQASDALYRVRDVIDPDTLVQPQDPTAMGNMQSMLALQFRMRNPGATPPRFMGRPRWLEEFAQFAAAERSALAGAGASSARSPGAADVTPPRKRRRRVSRRSKSPPAPAAARARRDRRSRSPGRRRARTPPKPAAAASSSRSRRRRASTTDTDEEDTTGDEEDAESDDSSSRPRRARH
eukprot:TRINITY_DN44105_c0_g1_i4.p1 TRINITY_DN44105_c0_g1~~TRINITY_DN44105_c0_g1_i4.p1  ORF type:complete len:294 (+),score=10.01 TRINITY_DN44105_c0_g1_i4:260-1141(+)